METSCHGVLTGPLSQTEKGHCQLCLAPGTQLMPRHRTLGQSPVEPEAMLTLLGAKNGSVGTDWQSEDQEG